MFKGKKIFIAGGTGFLGGAIARQLLAQGALVRTTHFSRAANFTHANLEWFKADLREEDACHAAVRGMDYAFNCAASTSGAADIRSNPLIHVTSNVVLNARLMEAAYRANIKRFVFLSSAAAYPPRGNHPLREDEMFTDEPAEVYYPAGWMKRYAEILCRMYGEKLNPQMPTVVIRPSNVYGPRDKFDWQRSHVTAALVRKVMERHRPILVWGTGNEVRDLIYVDDFVSGVLAAFGAAAPFLTANIGSGRGYSVKEILNTALAADGFSDAEIRFDPSRPQTVDKLLVDVTFARERLRFIAQTPLQEGLCQTIAWLRAHPPHD